MSKAQEAVAEEEVTGTEVATAEPTGGEVVAFDYGEDAGAGFEGMKSEDLSVPFLSILQSNSPQVEDKTPEGSEPGMLFNTVTSELIDGARGQVFLPVHFDRAYVEWVPRTKGGGFVGLHSPESEVVKKALEAVEGDRFTRLKTGDNDLIETKYMYGLLLSDDGQDVEGFATISFTSTKIKPFNNWLTSMRQVKGRPPIWAQIARIKTVKQKNDKGTFYNFSISPLNDTFSRSLVPSNSEVYQQAKEFRQMVLDGVARAAFETERAAGDTGSTSEDGPEVPF